MKFSILAVTPAMTDTGEQTTLWDDVWHYIYNTYINPSEFYENISTGTITTVRLIIIGMFIGLALAAYAAVFNKRVLGALVRRILEKECLSPDRAMTLDELGYDTIFMRWAVKHSTSLRRVVKCVEEENYNAELKQKMAEQEENAKNARSLPKFKETAYKINDLTDTFYIHEDMKYMADIKFEKKGTTLGGAIFMTFILLVAMLLLLGFLPTIMQIINDVIGAVGSSSTPDNIL